MTGYESKRAAARDKLVDDRRAYYEKFDDLYAVYLNGVYDGKKAAQPAQEPVAWLTRDSVDGCWYATAKKVGKDDKPLYTTPPQRPWVDLTNDDIFAAVRHLYGTAESAFMGRIDDIATARAIEAASRSKNT